MNTSNIHINNLYMKYTFVYFAILLTRKMFGAVPLPVTASLAVKALSLGLGSILWLLRGSDNLLAILLEVSLSFPLPFS